jgi:chromosomal replication initiation ATPase DnaA
MMAMQEPLKINPETAELLAARASARGLSVEEYLRRLLGVTEASSMPATIEEFMAAMESLAEDVEPLPREFSRDDIYFPEG